MTVSAPSSGAGAGVSAAQSLMAIGAFLLLSFIHRDLEPGVLSGDWAQYILHAKALAEGRGYTDIGYIFTQMNWLIGPRAYPPGLPLTLVPIVLTGSWAPALMRLLMVASGCLFLLMVYRRLRLTVHPWVAALAAMWTGVVIELAFASISVLSDLGFCALIWLVIATIDQPGTWTKGRMALVAVAGLGAMSYRVAGVALVPALLVYLLLNRDSRARAARVVFGIWAGLLALAVVIAPRLLPNRLLPPSVEQMANRVIGNVRAFLINMFDAQTYPLASNGLNDIYHVVMTLVMLIGAMVILRRGWRGFLPVFAGVYFVMLLVAPVGDTRYYWPLYPVIAVCVVQGVASTVGWLRAPLRREHVPAGALVAVVILAAAAYRGLRGQQPMGFSSYPDAVALSDYVKAAGERGEIRRIAFINPRVLTLRTGVPAMGLITARPGRIALELTRQGITHVTFGAFEATSCDPASLLNVKAAYPGAFQHVATFGRFTIERFTPPDESVLEHPLVPDVDPTTSGVCGAISGTSQAPVASAAGDLS